MDLLLNAGARAAAAGDRRGQGERCEGEGAPGVVVTESVFAIPGIGRLTIEAVTQRDYPIIQGVILVASFVYVLINLAIDLTYAFLDPRIRY